MQKNYFRLGASVIAAFLLLFSLTSCHDEEVENISELSYRHAYEDNFVKHFGEVNPNQTWDFSSYAKRYNLNGALTRATMEDTYKSIASDDGYYYIPSEITTYIANNFDERDDNSGKVQSFVLKADEACTFEVAYAFQGRSEPDFDLYCVVWDPAKNDGHGAAYRYQIFSKGEVEVSNNSTSWNVLGTTWVNNDAPSTKDYSYARSIPHQIDAPANSFIYFFVKITQTSTRNQSSTNNQFAWLGDELSSLDDPKTFGLVEIETPANIKAIDPNYEAYLLALDDFCLTCQENGYITDTQLKVRDFNDVLFLIAGNVPEPSTVYEKEIETIISKRYMIEDLYAYDYDFNDIVVDASQSTKTPYEYIHPTPSNPTGSFNILSDQTTVTQTATMAHLCGTLPFQITVGDNSFEKVTDPTDQTQTLKQLNGETTANTLTPAGSPGGNWDPDYKIDITGWDPKTNNITAAIMADKYSYTGSSLWPGEWTGVWTSEFPAPGDVPYIIAVDTDVEWMGEKISIPADWIGGDMSSYGDNNNSSPESGN